MSDTTLSELARVVAELAEKVSSLTGDADTRRPSQRARALSGQHRLRHVPVLDAGHIVGVLSALDIVRALSGVEPC